MTCEGSWIEGNYNGGWRKRGREDEQVSGRAAFVGIHILGHRARIMQHIPSTPSPRVA